MASWAEFATEEPGLAALVRARLEFSRHHVLATLRKDGSPRVSGTEVEFWRDDIYLGSMWNAMKVLDLRRDGRFAIHSNPADPDMVGGDSKLVGLAVEADDVEHRAFEDDLDPPTPFNLFRLDITEVVHTSLNAANDGIEVRFWKPGQGIRTVERS